MTLEMITLRELLRDPQYKAFFLKPPILPPHYTPETKPWKLMILKPHEQAWRSKRFGTYNEAFEGLKKMLPLIDNGAINCPSLTFRPPSKTVRIKGKLDSKGKPVLKTLWWKPQITSDMEHHDWCSYCRRPSIFRVAAITRASRGGFIIPTREVALRCMICGASDRMVDLRNPQNAQKWDLSLPKVY